MDIHKLDRQLFESLYTASKFPIQRKESKTGEITVILNFIGAFDLKQALKKPKIQVKNSKERHSRQATLFLA